MQRTLRCTAFTSLPLPGLTSSEVSRSQRPSWNQSDFHGDGKLTVPAATVSINGAISRSAPGGTGTYTVDADCTGSLVFGPPLAPAGPAYDVFVTFKGSQIQMIQTGPGSPVFQGTAERISR